MRFVTGVGALGAVACLMLPALMLSVAASSAEMRGVTKTEIRIGQTMPHSGPVSAFFVELHGTASPAISWRSRTR